MTRAPFSLVLGVALLAALVAAPLDLCAGCSAPAGSSRSRHPIATYDARLVRTPDALTLTIEFDCDLLNLNHGIPSATPGRFAAKDVREAARGFLRLVEEGTRIYDGEGRPVRPVSTLIDVEEIDQPLAMDDLESTRGRIELRFPPAADVDAYSILVDWGGWRRAVTTSLRCRLRDRNDDDARVNWSERTRYPLLPRLTDEPRSFHGELSYSPEPLDETLTGYSYVYVEADHVRHELVLPLMSLSGMLEFSPTAPSTTGDVLTADRRIIETELRKRFARARNLLVGDLPIATGRAAVRWFTRESLRRGVVTDDRPIPMATGFVGMLMVHPVDDAVETLRLDSSPCLEFVSDQVVTIVAGDAVERTITNHERPSTSWRGTPPRRAPLVAGTVSRDPPRRFGWLTILAALLASAACLMWRRRRTRVALLFLALIVFVVDALVPPRAKIAAADDAVLQSLVTGIYRACGREDEREALALLSEVSEAGLRERLYLDLRGQLRGPWATGAGTDVREVKLRDVAVRRRDARRIDARCTWTLSARIEHWGHVHDRVLEVDARVTARARDGRWRLASVRLLDKRIGGASSQPLSRLLKN